MPEFMYMKESITDYAGIMAKTIREWGEKEVLPSRKEYDEDYEHKLIYPAMKKLFVDMGLQKLVWPKEYGGAGIEPMALPTTLVRALEEVGKADPGMGFVFAGTFSLFTSIALEPHVNRELCTEFAPIYCESGEVRTGSLIFPEQGYLVGKEVANIKGRSIRVRAEPGDNEWVVNGEELRPVNSGAMADIFGVVCATDSGEIAYVLIPSNLEGVKRGDPILKTGLASDKNANVSLENVKIPDKYVVWRGEDAKYIGELVSWHTLCCCAICVGAMMDTYKTLKEWSTTRIIRGKPLKENPVDAIVLADVAEEIALSRILTYNLANTLSKSEIYGDRWSDEVSTLAEMIGMYVANAASKVIGRAMELMASMGYAREGDIEKHWRDVKTIQSSMGGSMPVLMDIARLFYECETL